MYVNLTECVHKLFADLDIDELVRAVMSPADSEVELTGTRVEQPVTAAVR